MPKGVAHSYEFRLAMMRLHKEGRPRHAELARCRTLVGQL